MPHNQVLLLLFCYIWCVVEFQFPSSQKLFDHRQEMQMKKLAVVLLCPDTQLVILVGSKLQIYPCLEALSDADTSSCLGEDRGERVAGSTVKFPPPSKHWLLFLRGLWETYQAAAIRKMGARCPVFLSVSQMPLSAIVMPLWKNQLQPLPAPAFGRNDFENPCCPKQTLATNIWPELGGRGGNRVLVSCKVSLR